MLKRGTDLQMFSNILRARRCSPLHFWAFLSPLSLGLLKQTLTNPSKVGTVTSGMTLSSSSGSRPRFTQQVQNQKLL